MPQLVEKFALHSKNYAFAIPAAADTPVNLKDIATAAGVFDDGKQVIAAGIRGCAGNYFAGNNVDLDPYQLVIAGDGFSESTAEFLADTWVRAESGIAISAVLVIYWK